MEDIIGTAFGNASLSNISNQDLVRIQEILSQDLPGLNLLEEKETIREEYLSLARLIENRLPRSKDFGTVADIFAMVRAIAFEELHPMICFHWNARWIDFLETGNFLTRPEQFDLVEVVYRLEEQFGIQIPDHDAVNLRTVRETVLYIWKAVTSEAINRENPSGM